MAVDDLLGALWLPGDGKVNPTDLTMALAKGARSGGARIVGAGPGDRRRRAEDRRRAPRDRRPHRPRATSRPRWSSTAPASGPRRSADQVGVTVPLHSAEHFYVVTDADRGRAPGPADHARPRRLHLLQGGGRRPGRRRLRARGQAVARRRTTIPHPFEFQLLEEDWDHFSVLMDEALRRVPALERDRDPQVLQRAGVVHPRQPVRAWARRPGCAATSSAPASTRSASRRPAAPGRALAEWIVEGEPTHRPGRPSTSAGSRAFNGNNRWLRDRVAEVLGLHYAVPWPNREMETGAAVPLLAACTTGWPPRGRRSARRWAGSGRTSSRPTGESPELDYAWGKPPWLPWSAAEHRATREAVAVFDQTSFSKYVVDGPGALRGAAVGLRERRRRAELGRAVYTPLLNRRGAYESDLTVTRTGEQEFLLVSSSATTVRDIDWIRRNVPDGCDARVRDVTTAYAVLGVMGPRSRDLLQRLTDADLGEEAFPFATSRMISLGAATVRATRMTYVGELGWELMVPVEFAGGRARPAAARGAGRRRGQRRLLRDRLAAAGEGLPRVRSRPRRRTTPRSRRGWCSPPR